MAGASCAMQLFSYEAACRAEGVHLEGVLQGAHLDTLSHKPCSCRPVPKQRLSNGELAVQVVSDTPKGGSFRAFLDECQYSTKSILRYEQIFGPGYVSTGGFETTKVLLPLPAGLQAHAQGCSSCTNIDSLLLWCWGPPRSQGYAFTLYLRCLCSAAHAAAQPGSCASAWACGMT